MSAPFDESDAPVDDTVRTSVSGVDNTLLQSPTGSRPHAVRDAGETGARRAGTTRYRVERLLGEGGMGSVLLCTDRLIGRRVAMKLIRDDGSPAPADVEARFLREARVQGQLEHPAIAPVYDLGRDAADAAYFTMKRIHGITLAEVIDGLREGEASAVATHTLRRRLTAFSSVCLAVDFAHQRGVIHRDLKPANVMLGDFGEVYVLDWGVARLSDDPVNDPIPTAIEPVRDVEGAPPTQNQIAGSPGHMSPEQLTGRTLTPASDVYALGVLLFELVCLEPFHQERSLTRQLVAALAGIEARPSVRVPRLALPPELDVICARATALLEADRYPSARALQQAIEAYLDGERDLQLRRALAEQHAQRATAALGKPDALDNAERRRAIGDIGRALALDPDNRDAAHALLRLLDRPPREVPPEVAAWLDDELAGRRKAGLSFVASSFAQTFGPLFALIAWAGVLRPGLFVAFVAVAACAIGFAAWVGRTARPSSNLAQPNVVLSAITFALAGTLFGPFFVSLTMITINVFGTTMTVPERRRWWPTFISLATFAAPFAAQAAGLLPRFYGFDDGRLILYPVLFRYTPVPTMVLLVAVSVALIIGSGRVANRLRRNVADAQQQLALQRWQLAQLVPETAPSA